MRDKLPVSICVPTFNGATYLRECLDSIIAQSFPDFEVLIVDDQSIDVSHEIARSYAARDPRFRVMRNEQNLGLVGNWNQCALLAWGEWVKFLFQDDILEADCLEKMLAVCTPKTSMVVCKRKIIFDEVAKEIETRYKCFTEKFNMDRVFRNETVISPEYFCKAVIDNMLENFVGEPTAVLLHRSVFSRFGFFNPHLIQYCDLEYWIRVASNTGLIYVPDVLAGFRLHGKATSAVNRSSRKFKSFLDKLVCYHEFVFNPLYRPLRSYAAQCKPPYNLNQWFALWLKYANKLARQASKDPLNPDQGLLEEMEELKRLYPGFRTVRKIPFSLRYGLYKWKIQSFLSTHLNIKKSKGIEND